MIGICGGYQMMGREVRDEEGIESGGAVSGLNLLPVVTTFESRKQLTQTDWQSSVLCRAYAVLGRTAEPSTHVQNEREWETTAHHDKIIGDRYGSTIS